MSTGQPRRVRVSWRYKGGRKPLGTVDITRGRGKIDGSGGRTGWGNPFPVETYGRDEAIRLFRELLRASPDLVARVRARLARQDLACWCQPDQACHGDVLLAVARGEAP